MWFSFHLNESEALIIHLSFAEFKSVCILFFLKLLRLTFNFTFNIDFLIYCVKRSGGKYKIALNDNNLLFLFYLLHVSFTLHRTLNSFSTHSYSSDSNLKYFNNRGRTTKFWLNLSKPSLNIAIPYSFICNYVGIVILFFVKYPHIDIFLTVVWCI